MSLNRWVGKQNVRYSHDEILLSHKEEWSSDTCHNMDELWKHYAEWKKPGTEGHML